MSTYLLGIEPSTLRERADLAAVDQRLLELGEERSLSALGERTDLLRLAGRIDEAMDVANEAVRQARFDGERERLVAARIRRAVVQQYSAKPDAALVELSECATEAANYGWAQTEALALQHRGTVNFELDRLDDAVRDLNDALIIRIRLNASPEQIDSTMIALGVLLELSDRRGELTSSGG